MPRHTNTSNNKIKPLLNVLKNKQCSYIVKGNIYYSKFAKDHCFLVKYFCILGKLHKHFCVS